MPTSVANVVAKSMTGHSGPPDRTGGKPAAPKAVLPANVGEVERIASAVGGAALIGFGLTQRGLAGILLPLAGGALVLRGATGTCSMYAALGVNTNKDRSARAGVEATAGYKLEEMVRVNAPVDETFRFWRRLENLPKFMEHLREVRTLDPRRSHWVAEGPLGVTVEWQAEIIREEPNRLIAWQSLPGSDVDTAGAVHFTRAPGGRGTEVRVSLKYDPPAGKAGAWVASLFGEAPEQQVKSDLQRFKQLMEAGSIAVTGRR